MPDRISLPEVREIDGVRWVRAAEPMKMPPRQQIVSAARFDIQMSIIAALDKYDISYAELQMILADELASWSQWQVRDEWYGPKEAEVNSDAR